MFLNSLDVCPFIVTKIISKITVWKLTFSQITFREISCLNRITPLVSQVHAMCTEAVNFSSNSTVWFESLCPSQQFLQAISESCKERTTLPPTSWVEPVPSSGESVLLKDTTQWICRRWGWNQQHFDPQSNALLTEPLCSTVVSQFQQYKVLYYIKVQAKNWTSYKYTLK